MTNETLAYLTPVVMLLGIAAVSGLLYWDIVRRHPPAMPRLQALDPAKAINNIPPDQLNNTAKRAAK